MKNNTRSDTKKDTISTTTKSNLGKKTATSTTTNKKDTISSPTKENASVKTNSKTDPKGSPTKSKTGDKSNLVSTQNSKATLDVKKTTAKKDTINTNMTDTKSIKGKAQSPSVKDKTSPSKTSNSTKPKDIISNNKEKLKSDNKEAISGKNTARDNKKEDINNTINNNNNNSIMIDSSNNNNINEIEKSEIDKNTQSDNKNLNNKDNNDLIKINKMDKEETNTIKSCNGFEESKLTIQKSDFFPNIIVDKKPQLSEKNDNQDNNLINLEGEDVCKLNKLTIKKEFLLPAKNNLNSSCYNIHNNNNSYISKRYGRLVSPTKKNKGVSVFSKHSVNIDSNTNNNNCSIYSPLNNNINNNNKVYFDNNFNTENLSYKNAEYYNYNYLHADRKPFFKFELIKSINDSINNNSTSNSTNNFNNNNINFNINYNNISENHLEYLKELKAKYKEKPDLSNITVPANTLTKEALLSPDLAFSKEYKNILEKQKLKLTGNIYNSNNLIKGSNTSNLNKYSNNLFNTRNKKSNISTILSKKKQGLNIQRANTNTDYVNDKFYKGFKANTTKTYTKDSCYNATKDSKGLTTKGADMYVKFCERMKMNL